MIFLERTITIKKNNATIDESIVLYKGDKNVELQFVVKNNPYKSKKSTVPTYAQLIIDRKTADSIFSSVVKIANDKVTFTVTGDMIDELNELGTYDFQIRLYNDDKTSRATLPPIEQGIIIKEPICEGDEEIENGIGVINESKTTNGEEVETFDDKGNYNKTSWENGDIITAQKMNKIEDALDSIVDVSKTHANIYHSHDNYATKQYVQDTIGNIEINGGDINLNNYITKEYMDSIINVIEKTEIGFDDLPNGKNMCYLKGNLIIKDLDGNRLTSTGECSNVIAQINKLDTNTAKSVDVHTLDNKYFEIDILKGTCKKSAYDVTKEFVNQGMNSVKDTLNATINSTLGDIDNLLGGI